MKITTNKDLRRMYNLINDLYFQDKLPKNFPIRFGRCTGTTMAYTRFLPGKKQIMEVVIRKYGKGQAKTSILSLIHEMIHVNFLMDGKYTAKYACKAPKLNAWNRPWSKEVRRLAGLGLFDWIV